MILRLTERTDRIAHIPRILYHWRAHPRLDRRRRQPSRTPTSRRATPSPRTWAHRRGRRGRLRAARALPRGPPGRARRRSVDLVLAVDDDRRAGRRGRLLARPAPPQLERRARRARRTLLDARPPRSPPPASPTTASPPSPRPGRTRRRAGRRRRRRHRRAPPAHADPRHRPHPRLAHPPARLQRPTRHRRRRTRPPRPRRPHPPGRHRHPRGHPPPPPARRALVDGRPVRLRDLGLQRQRGERDPRHPPRHLRAARRPGPRATANSPSSTTACAPADDHQRTVIVPDARLRTTGPDPTTNDLPAIWRLRTHLGPAPTPTTPTTTPTTAPTAATSSRSRSES